MRILPATPQAIDEAVAILRLGGCVAHATETCYGLACDLSNLAAVEKLFRIKSRSTTQPVSALFASIDDAKRYVIWNARAEDYAKNLPGPLTLILLLRENASVRLYPTPLFITHYKLPTTIGIRVSPHPIALALVQGFGSPVSTTSANLHGRPSPYSAQEIARQLEGRTDQPDAILDSGTLPLLPPSRIIDLTSDQPKILRK